MLVHHVCKLSALAHEGLDFPEKCKIVLFVCLTLIDFLKKITLIFISLRHCSLPYRQYNFINGPKHRPLLESDKRL